METEELLEKKSTTEFPRPRTVPNSGSYNQAGTVFQMPAHFGGVEGGLAPLVYRDTITAATMYETDGEQLARLLPKNFSLLRNEIMVASMMNRGVDWMGGEPYNILAVNVPVRFEGERDNLEGWYNLVTWENNPIPILPGRESAGIPKIPGNIEDFRFDGSEMRSWAHLSGHTFCELHFTNIADADPQTEAAVKEEFTEMDWMGWRHIPSLGNQGGADLSHATLFPQEFECRSVRIARAEVQWFAPQPWKLPTQVHIISQLAALPVSGTGKALLLDARNVLRADLTKVLY
ncbi:acetoacetate decarboxylase family protein [uncultured Microbulbifer sp.]|uniref:acetoacetate decarboxylase family protein n=1 Tax=uncultured Microbulbifer sp. TaxID=348147 RepID=UPI00261DA66A|nr:acetoacetate decarboxylase family protein [uncultured Microbulbifer sp.]